MTRKPARRPEPRTLTVHGKAGSPFEEWELTARVDFRAAWLVELSSGDVARILAVLERIVVEHNMPDADGGLAATLGDVDPYDGLMHVVGELVDGIPKLPPR